MGRLLVLVLIVVVIVWALKRALADPRGRARGASEGDLVSCAHCGVNLPKAEARSAGGRHYCSEEHWRLGPRDG